MSKKEEERARKAREEYVELLKMKQGLIEESELIPETGYVEIPELHGLAKFGNFVYHNKAFILIGAFFLAVAVFLTVQIATRKIYDLYVLVISTSGSSELLWRYDDIEDALTKYCPDFDNNGYVKVGINFIDLGAVNEGTEYGSAQTMKFSSELYMGESQMFIGDEGFWEYLYGNEDGLDVQIFEDLSEYFPEDELYRKTGLHINSTDLHKDARWDTCPDSINIFLRCEFDTATGNKKNAQEQRERAHIVFQNIVEGNVVNPPAEE